jgi:dihydrodipicolinate synthase/N-acetylneuraminate lyase
MSIKLEGILSANVTPFKENYDLDEPGLRKLIRYQAAPEGISAIVCNAGAGEGAMLSRQERVRIIEIICGHHADAATCLRLEFDRQPGICDSILS